MANEEHLAILSQGVEAWNAWQRANHYDVRPNLRGADLKGADLRRADLIHADLIHADLSGAQLEWAELEGADLSEAVLEGTDLHGVSLRWANLRGAILEGASLKMADLDGVELSGASITNTHVGGTHFANLDLSGVRGLDTVIHYSPSHMSIDTLVKSEGKIPEVFLRGCGVPDSWIAYLPSLIGALEPVQFYSCFISYSTKDQDFAQRLYERMQSHHLRVWFAPEEMKAGRKLHEQIDQAIRVHDKLVLVLSESSIQSEWVMTEIRKARKAELRDKRQKLFPIRLVDMDTLRDWECFDADNGKDLAIEVREYYIPDFTRWKDHDAFEREFQKLLSALKAVDTPPVPRAVSKNEPKDTSEDGQSVLQLKKRRLQKLEQQAALKGINTPPEVEIEIEDLREEIERLEEHIGATSSSP